MPDSAKQLLELRQLGETMLGNLSALDEQIAAAQQAGDPILAEKIKQSGLEILKDYESVIAEEESAKADLQKSLATGEFLTEGLQEEGRKLDFSSDGIAQRYEEGLSSLFGAPVDLRSGVDPATRIGMAFKTADNKLEYLRNKFGPDNVQRMDLGGGQVTLIRNPNDPEGKFVATDEFGFSYKDAIDISGEIFPMAGSVAGGLAAAAGPLKSPLGVTTGSASGYTAAASLQDAVASWVTDVGPNVIEAIPQRASEAALGMAIEYPLLKTGRVVGPAIKRMSSGKENAIQMVRRTNDANLKAQGLDIGFARFAEGGESKLQGRLQAGRELPSSAIRNDVAIGLKRLEHFKVKLSASSDRSKLMYDETVRDLQREADNLFTLVSAYDQRAATALRAEADADIARYMTRPTQDVEAAANYVNSVIKESEVAANQIKNDTYSAFYARPEVNAIEFDPLKVAKMVEAQYFEGVSRNPALEKALSGIRQRVGNQKKLQKIETSLKTKMKPEKREALKRERDSLIQLSGPITAKQMDEYVSLFREAYPDAGLVGQPSGKRTAGRAAETLQSMRDSAYEKAGVLGDWNYATQVYRQRLGFEEGTLGNVLKETLGRTDLTPAQMMNQIISNPRAIRDVVGAAALTSPESAAKMASTLRQQYMQSIGVTGNTPSGYTGKLDFDPDIVRELFSVRPDGSVNGLVGERMVQKMDLLKKRIEAQKLDPSKITEDELAALQGTLSENQYKALIDSVTERLVNQKELDAIQDNILFDIASKGHVEAVDRPQFGRALLNLERPTSRVTSTISKFSPEVQESIRGDAWEQFISRYHKSSDTGFGEFDLWNAQKVVDDISKDTRLRPRLNAIFGERWVDKFVIASEQLAIIQSASKATPGGVRGGVAVSPQGGARSWISILTLKEPIRRRWIDAAYRARKASPFIDRIARKDLTQEQYVSALEDTSKYLLTTSQGLMALTQTGKYDPEYAAEIGNLIGTVSPEGLDFERKEAGRGQIMNPQR
jgi:hypothetical protein